MGSSDATGHLTTEELFRQHADFVARFLGRLGVPSSQLEDALQEVFLVAHRNGGYRPGIAKPTSYLAGIAIRAAARQKQRLGAAHRRHSDAPVDEMAGELVDPARALQVRQDLQRLQHALERLPEELCTTLLLVEMEGESCVSVAAGLGCPVGTVYWRLHQARKQVQAALRSDGAGPARSWLMLLGLDGFGRSEPSRLLRLAREQPAPSTTLAQRLARHQQLVEAGAELPAWAAGYAPHAASWLALLGAGPIAVGFAASAAVAAAALLAGQSAAHELRRQEPRALAAVRVVGPRPPATTAALEPPAHEAPRAAHAVDRITTSLRTERDRARVRAGTSIDARLARATERDSRPVADAHAASESAATPAHAESAAPRESDPRADDSAKAAPEAPRAPADRADAIAKKDNGAAMSDAEFAEMRDIARAERLLSDDPERALALTRAMQTGFPEGYFREERAYLEVMALHELGRTREMREKAAAFLRAYPAGLYSSRVRKAVAGGRN